jgi:hypothetical protein
MKRAVSFFAVLLLAPFAHAADNHTPGYHDITGIVIHSKTEPIAPTWAGLTQVTFAALTWATPNVCSTSAVVVRDNDAHVVAALHAAKAQDKPVRLFVDDSQLHSVYCILRAVQY